jgi:hypothetical protein
LAFVRELACDRRLHTNLDWCGSLRNRCEDHNAEPTKCCFTDLG